MDLRPLRAERLPGNPLLTTGTYPQLGGNINGPSVIRVPDWVQNPLGRYYLYFAHHHGGSIRLAVADASEGPYRLHEGGVLPLEETPCNEHIASPDAHVLADEGEIRLYVHGTGEHPDYPGRQVSYLARSTDGVSFSVEPQVMGPFYLRAFRWDGSWHALVKVNNDSAALLRSPDGIEPFQMGPSLLPRCRHTAVRVEGDRLRIVFSRIADEPERLLQCSMGLAGDWRAWPRDLTDPEELLQPARDWEGADQPLAPSVPGGSWEPVRQLRDPALFDDGERSLLFYSIAGEQGLAVARLVRAEA